MYATETSMFCWYINCKVDKVYSTFSSSPVTTKNTIYLISVICAELQWFIWFHMWYKITFATWYSDPSNTNSPAFLSCFISKSPFSRKPWSTFMQHINYIFFKIPILMDPSFDVTNIQKIFLWIFYYMMTAQERIAITSH